MAKIEIKPSQMSVNVSNNTPNLSSLTIPVAFAQQLGANVSQAAKQFDKIKDDQRKIEDQNRSWKIISEKRREIDKALLIAGNKTNLDEAESILNDVYEIDLSNERKDVQYAVNQYLVKNKIKDRSNIFKAVTAKTAEETLLNDNDFLINNFQKRISPVDNERAAADRDFLSWFDDPINKSKRSQKDHEDLKNKYEILKAEALNKLDIERTPFQVLLNAEEIKKNFGLQKGELYLKQAQNKLLSDLDSYLIFEDKQIDERSKKQISLFSEFAVKITEKQDVPTFLELEDLKDKGSINSAQYEALVGILMDDDKLTNEELTNQINNQIVIAENVNELDDINNVLSSSREILGNVAVKDIAVYNKLLSTLKQDPTKHEDYKKLYNVLRANLNDLGGLADVLTGPGGITPADKIETGDALSRFNTYVSNGMQPEDAYIKVISTITKEKIPDVYSPNLKPLYVGIDDIKTDIQKNPSEYFNNKIAEVAKKLSRGEIKPDDFFEDVERIDMLRNVYNVRVNVLGVDKALEPKATDEMNIKELLQSLSSKT